ncbi:hypothetical protein KO507_18370 [Gilvimarinus agarilyticus]|uniref:L-dopachrome tautomerase-related protein n=1 Tax=Gilvimarinus sp. 2_MG-2023 TaxID=3062666 RepID=UPI001C09B20D|nr:L-dopachrome tautomerase-related protein [Gilvimarinus sp. 2_MG-2023]MBU2887736.1 hypothetical protein [Gilvimarinus agarilyticus]MDO6572383.1 L-dopachrome tautomerase-related protein [Gilvimarinus sp. 2_MG-2023]
MSTHLAYNPKPKMVELLPDGSYQRYPDTTFTPALNGVLGAIVDNQDILWFLDTIWGEEARGRVIGWDINKNELHRIYYVSRPVVHDAYILNDMAVDRKNNAMYITDTAGSTTSALLVLDLTTGSIRRVLEGSFATVPEDIDLVIDETVITMQGKPARVGVNPITIDVNNQWVYFAPMSSKTLYRVKTEDLNNSNLTSSELESRVERYANKPKSDGITIDAENNVYVSDLENKAIGVITNDRQYKILHQDDQKLSWVEGFANAGGNDILATSNKLHLSPAFTNASPTPNNFYILKIKSLAPATPGR